MSEEKVILAPMTAMAMMKAMYPKTRERLFDIIATVVALPDAFDGPEADKIVQPAIDIIRGWCSEADLIKTLKVATVMSKLSRS